MRRSSRSWRTRRRELSNECDSSGSRDVSTRPNQGVQYAATGLADARRQLGRFIDAVYNVKRIHPSLGYLTPQEFEAERNERRSPGRVKSA